MTLNLDQIETDLAAGRTDDAPEYPEGYQRTVRQLIEEVKRLRHQAIGLKESASKSLILYANAGTEADGLRFEVERLRAEVERLTLRQAHPQRGASQDTASPRPGPSTGSGHGFLAWAMQVEDALPPGAAKGVNVEELRRWFEEGMTVDGAAERVRGEGP